MIVLSRRVDETVVIGSDILVTPTDIDSRIARLVAHGTMLGGAEDGARFNAVHELSVGQSFRVGPMVVVTVVDIRGDMVRIGINAPKHLSVHRKEVVDKIRRAQQQQPPEAT